MTQNKDESILALLGQAQALAQNADLSGYARLNGRYRDEGRPRAQSQTKLAYTAGSNIGKALHRENKSSDEIAETLERLSRQYAGYDHALIAGWTAKTPLEVLSQVINAYPEEVGHSSQFSPMLRHAAVLAHLDLPEPIGSPLLTPTKAGRTLIYGIEPSAGTEPLVHGHVVRVVAPLADENDAPALERVTRRLWEEADQHTIVILQEVFPDPECIDKAEQVFAGEALNSTLYLGTDRADITRTPPFRVLFCTWTQPRRNKQNRCLVVSCPSPTKSRCHVAM